MILSYVCRTIYCQTVASITVDLRKKSAELTLAHRNVIVATSDETGTLAAATVDLTQFEKVDQWLISQGGEMHRTAINFYDEIFPCNKHKKPVG